MNILAFKKIAFLVLTTIVFIISCNPSDIVNDNDNDSGDDMDQNDEEESDDSSSQAPNQEPPYSGTIFLAPDVIKSTDPTNFQSIAYTGQGLRTMYDRRTNSFVENNAFLFDAVYSDGISFEIQVNPEFETRENAEVQAEKYAVVLGRIPKVIRKDAETVWIHKGVAAFGGGNNNFLIHTGQGELYETDGILEETFVHEGSHTSLDNPHATATGWKAAQNADNNFISTYGRDFPVREDLAESYLMYLAVTFRPERISQELKDNVERLIPNRLQYFEDLEFDISPVE